MEDYKDELDDYLKNLEKHRIHDFLYRISEKDYDNIMAPFRDLKTSKQHAYKAIIRKKISEKLKLDRLDVIFFTDNEIYIKIYIKISQKEGADRRACGINPQLLEEYKEKYFSDDVFKENSFSLLESVVEDTLSFKVLNPYDFKKRFISVFINIIELIVIIGTQIEKDKDIKGFSLYLLREMFDSFLIYISEDLLFHFSNQDKKAIEFLSCFNVNETIDSKGVKYKANPILDATNHAWNMTTIRSTMFQYKHAKQDFYNKKNALISIKDRLKDYRNELQQLNQQNMETNLKLENTIAKIKSNEKNLEKVKSSTAQQIKFLDDNVEKVFEKKLLVSKLFKNEDKLLDEKKIIEHEIRDIDIKFLNKKKDFDIWVKKYNENEKVLKNIEQKGHPIDKQYENLKEALAKTLARR